MLGDHARVVEQRGLRVADPGGAGQRGVGILVAEDAGEERAGVVQAREATQPLPNRIRHRRRYRHAPRPLCRTNVLRS